MRRQAQTPRRSAPPPAHRAMSFRARWARPACSGVVGRVMRFEAARDARRRALAPNAGISPRTSASAAASSIPGRRMRGLPRTGRGWSTRCRPRRAAIEHDAHRRAELVAYVGGRGRTDMPKAIGRWRGDATAELVQQLQRQGMVRHAQAHRILPAGDGVDHRRMALEYQRQGAGPEGVGEAVRHFPECRSPSARCAASGRCTISGWSAGRPLAAKILATASALLASAPRPYTVSVGKATRSPARSKLPPRGKPHSSRMPIRRRAASADSWTCCASLPMTVKCPILRPGRAWCLP
jgi:hypothetical protein